MDVPAVSVIMPVFNPCDDHLAIAVASVLRQTVFGLELILIDSSSNDVVERFVRHCRDRRVRYVRFTSAPSISGQLNMGLEMAEADIVSRMDSDDISHPERLALQLACLDGDRDLDLVGGNIRVIDRFGRVVGARQYPLAHEAILREMRRGVPFCHPSVTFRRSAVMAVGGYRATGFPIEDYDLYSRLAKAGAKFCNVGTDLLYYRLHAGQLKCTRTRDCIRGVVAVKQMYWYGSMSLIERCRMWAEWLASGLPEQVLYTCVQRWLYNSVSGPSWRRRLPIRDKGMARHEREVCGATP